MIKTQNQWVADQLHQALNRNITRLASRIKDLRDADWDIVARSNGKDYEYVLSK